MAKKYNFIVKPDYHQSIFAGALLQTTTDWFYLTSIVNEKDDTIPMVQKVKNADFQTSKVITLEDAITPFDATVVLENHFGLNQLQDYKIENIKKAEKPIPTIDKPRPHFGNLPIKETPTEKPINTPKSDFKLLEAAAKLNQQWILANADLILIMQELPNKRLEFLKMALTMTESETKSKIQDSLLEIMILNRGNDNKNTETLQ
jgi:hypothetical protein